MRRSRNRTANDAGLVPSGDDTRLLRALLAVTGLHFGGGLYEARVVIPKWAAVPTPSEVGPALEQSGHVASGRVFWPYTGVPLMVLTAANLPAAWRCRDARRPWWLAYVGTMAAGSVVTVGFFVPTIRRLSNAEDMPEATVRTLVRRWVRFDRVRLTLGIAGWVAGLTALSGTKRPSCH